MDDVESVIVSVSGQVDVGQAEQWFAVVCEAYDAFGENWNLFKDALATRAYSASFSSEVAENFVRALEDEVSDTTGVLRQVCVDRRDQLPRLYETLVAEERQALAELTDQSAAAAPPAPEFGDPAAWYEHLTTGHHWAGWTGGEDDWDTFTTWFRQYAEPAGVLDEANSLIDRVAAAPDKIAAFAELGITIAAESASAAAEGDTAAEDERWRTFLRENAHRFRGTAASWTFFHGWVLAEASVQGLSSYAEGFVQYAEAFADKNEAFAAYGITPGGEPAEPAEQSAPEEEAAPEQVARRIIGDVADAVLDDAPSAAALPRADVEQLIAEILRDRAAAAS